MSWTLASDIDGTLTGDRAALDALREKIDRARAEGELTLILCTGRRYDDVLDGIANEGLPEPDAIVAQVGTEIYLPPFEPDAEPLAAWRENVAHGFSRDEALGFLEGEPTLTLQPDRHNTALKVSAERVGEMPVDDAVRRITLRAAARPGRYQVVWSMGRFLDILPANAGKGYAVTFVARRLGVDRRRLVGAGDTGNDASLLEHLPYGIVVGNAKPELLEVAERHPGRVYVAEAPHAAGVWEGLRRFGDR